MVFRHNRPKVKTKKLFLLNSLFFNKIACSSSASSRRPSTGSKSAAPSQQQQQQQQKHRILRPPRMSPVTCSIHCPLSSNFPELSCVSCHSLFHPKCVGLADGMNYFSFDFYCFACTPPAGKENNEPPFKKAAVSVGQVGGRHKR